MQPESSATILLVDDQPNNLLALEAILEEPGLKLVRAGSGREALKSVLDQDFALILMDVQMPDLDGFETAALIRQRDRCRYTPIIFLTAHERAELQLFKGYSLGAVDYLIKPVLPDILKSKVRVFVDLFCKNQEVKRQAELLRQNQEEQHAQRLREEKQRWEMERLREEAAREKRAAEEMAQTVADRVRAEKQVREHARQQALVAELGQQALEGVELDVLMQRAVEFLAPALDVANCFILELLPDCETLELRAGVGNRKECAALAVLWTDSNGAAVLSGESVLFEDLQPNVRLGDTPYLLENFEVSGLGVLIRGQPRSFGVLGVHSRTKRKFTSDAVHFLETVANVLATAILRKRSEDELMAVKDELAVQLKDMTRLHELSARLSSTLDLQATLEQVLAAVVGLQDTEQGALLLRDRERNELYTVVSVGFSDEYLREYARLPANGSAAGMAFLERQRVVIEDVETDGTFVPWLPAARLAGYQALCSTPLVTPKGEVIGTIVTYFRRPRRPSERELRLVELYARQAADAIDNARLYAEIQEANGRKDEFLAMLSHELRNPLAPLLNALHILHLLAGDNPAFEQTRTLAERQARHLTKLVDDLLDLSRITRGKIQLRKEPVDYAAVAQRAVESVRPLFETRGHQLEVVVPPLGLVEADPTRLEQIFVNLLNNAAKYTEPGGRIWFTGERAGGELIVRVRDTGIGIAPEMLARVFDMFMQEDRSLDRAQGGLGIGLTLVRSLVEMHGGTIAATSAGLGKGSEFLIRLPLLRTLSLPGEAPSNGSASDSVRSLRILVVDDNRDAAESLSFLLKLQGHEVSTAFDGSAAVETARRFQPCVVLLDIGLPGISGYEVARQLRSLAGLENILLVAMTGYGQEEDLRRSREVGFDHHFVKPVDPSELHDLLHRHTAGI